MNYRLKGILRYVFSFTAPLLTNMETIESITETGRLLIRPLSLADTPSLTTILSDPEVSKHTIQGVCNETSTREFIKKSMSCYESHGYGPWALIDKGSKAFIGFCGISPEPVGQLIEINLGYSLARHYWGLGLATESTRAVLTYALGKKKFKSVIVIIEPDHIASVRVAEKTGFSDFQNENFHGKNVRIYRMTRDQWSCHKQKVLQEPGF